MYSSKLIQAIIELICNEDTSQVQHFPIEKEIELNRHAGRYFHHALDSDEDEHDSETKL